jgi:hypothetical protein
MGFLHNKLRNRLAHGTVDKLLYVRANHMLFNPLEEPVELNSESESEADSDLEI